jgi:hypothetical protein
MRQILREAEEINQAISELPTAELMNIYTEIQS